MKYGLLFPGYSTQFVGMGKELYDDSRIMQELFETASSCLPINFVKLCFASSDSTLKKVQHAYPALFLTSLAIAQMLKELDFEVAEVAGLGVGQLSALSFAGGITLPDGLYLFAKCAEMYQEALASWRVGAIKVKGLDYDLLAQACTRSETEKHPLTIAISFSKDEHVVTGNRDQVDDLEVSLKDKGIEVTEYPVEQGLQSPLMDPILLHLKKYLAKVDFKPLHIPLISSLDGQRLQEPKDIEELFIQHLRQPIRWDLVSKEMADWDVIIQVGPGKRLAEYAAKQYPEKKVIAINKPEDVVELKKIIEAHPE